MDRASATEAIDVGSIPGRVKPKTIKTLVFTLKGPFEASAVSGRQVAAWLEDQKVPSLSPGLGNFVIKCTV